MEPQQTQRGLEDIDAGAQIRRLLAAARRNRFRLVLFAAFGLVVGAAVATVVPDRYESQTRLIIRERELIDDSRLLRSIQEKPLVQKEATLAAELKSFAWIYETLQQVEWPEFAAIRGQPAKVHELVDRVRAPGTFGVDVSTDAVGDLLVTISFNWFDPVKARDFVLVTRKKWIQRREEEQRSYWKQQLLEAEKILGERQAEYQLAVDNKRKFETEHDLSFAWDENTDAALKTKLVQDRTTLEGQISELEVKVRDLQERLDREPQHIEQKIQEKNPKYEAAMQALAMEEATLKQLLEKYTESYYKVKDQREKVEAAKRAFAEVKDHQFAETRIDQQLNPVWAKLSEELSMLGPELTGKRRQLETVAAQLQAVDARLAAQPALMAQHRDLSQRYERALAMYNDAERDIAPLRDRVNYLERRSANLFGDDEAQLGNAFQILEDPVADDTPMGLPKPVFALIGMLVGVALGLALALLGEMTRSTYADAQEVQSAFQLPVLGAVARIATPLELRRARLRELAHAAGSLLVLVTLGVFVYVATAHPDKLPLSFQRTIEDLKTAFQ